MNIIYNKLFLEHDTGNHPENPKRLESLGQLESTEILNGEDYLELVHKPAHIEKVRKASKGSSPLDIDTITSPRSYEAAIHAVGAAVMASESNDFAVVRPPGHHSYPTCASGFCLFNNIAIAVQNLVKQGKRVFVLDFDGHCGDGTEHIFYETDQVLFLSFHQFPAFPGKGSVDEIGLGMGAGYTINVPLPPASGDDILEKALNEFLPVAHQFDPDAVAISAGFDAHQADPLLDLRWTVNSYYEIGKRIKEELGDSFALLEGGYNLEWLPQCFYNFLDGMNEKPMKYEEYLTESMIQVHDEYELRASILKSNLSNYWKF